MQGTVRQAEVIILGGGPAGLSAALVLARARRRVVVFDAGAPRNQASRGVFGLLSRDGISPAELSAIAREQIARYDCVRFVTKRVDSIRPLGFADAGEARSGGTDRTGFEVCAEDGEAVRAPLALLALGMRDQYPVLQGFREHWGRRVIHCPFCHGWENGDRKWALLAKNLDEVDAAPHLLQWTSELVVIAPGLSISSELEAKLSTGGIAIDRRVPVALISDEQPRSAPGSDEAGALPELSGVQMSDGSTIDCQTLVHQPAQYQTALVEGCDLALDQQGRVIVDGTMQTSRAGLYAAGDLTPGPQTVALASAEGAKAGIFLSKALSTMG